MAALIDSQAFVILALAVSQITEVAEELISLRGAATTIQQLMATLTSEEKLQLDYFSLNRIRIPGIT